MTDQIFPRCGVNFNDSIASAFQRACLVERTLLVGNEQNKTIATPGFHRPYLGWVGENYRGGTVIVAKNPGGNGEDSPKNGIDEELDRRIGRFSQENDPTSALHEISKLYLAQKNIGMHRILDEVRLGLNEEISSFAYLNPCPYRTPGAPKMKDCLQLVIAPVLTALQPDTVIYLNKTVGDDVHQLKQRGHWKNLGSLRWSYVLQRNRKDSGGLSVEGHKRLMTAGADNADRAGYRLLGS
jgi:hypothetical protein